MLYLQPGVEPDEGSFGRVEPALEVDDETGLCYQVAVKRLQRERVLKELPIRGRRSSAEGARFLFDQERRLWCSLRPHPNLVRAIRARRVWLKAIPEISSRLPAPKKRPGLRSN